MATEETSGLALNIYTITFRAELSWDVEDDGYRGLKGLAGRFRGCKPRLHHDESLPTIKLYQSWITEE